MENIFTICRRSEYLTVVKISAHICVCLRAGFRHPGTYPKKTWWVFVGYTHLKNPPPNNPHFYYNLILVYTLYATNNAIFYCFKALSY